MGNRFNGGSTETAVGANGRRRGVVLTAQGLEKLNAARRQVEQQDNYGQRFTLEELCDRTNLSLKTITKVLDAKTTVDRHTLEAFFCAFNLTLDRTDYTFPTPLSPPPSPTHPPSHPSTHPLPTPHTSWGEAIDVALFYGREGELQTLTQWLVADHCRLVLLLGMGGMGKTALSVKLAQTVAPQFEFVLWRSLRDAPLLADVLADVLPIVSQQQAVKLPTGPTAQIACLINYLRQHRCLLVLDNAESILQSGGAVGHYLPGYESYGDLLRQVGECSHQSCLVLTSREKPGEIAAMEGDSLPVRSHALPGLKAPDSQALLAAKGLSGTAAEHQTLIDRYRGNPLALKMVATSIRDLFGGDMGEFLRDHTLVFSGMRHLLQQQCDRTSDLEKQVMTWLAIHREWVPLGQLQADLGSAIPRRQLLEALDALTRRSLIERGELGFTQQPVVMEYVLEKSLEQVLHDLLSWGTPHPSPLPRGEGTGGSAESLTFANAVVATTPLPEEEGPGVRGNPWFHQYPLMRASAKEYLRQSQGRVILAPLAERLKAEVPSPEQLAIHLQRVLERVRSHFAQTPSYSAANLLHLLHHLGCDLSGYDCSQLWVRQAHLAAVPLRGVNFTGATFEHTTFAQPSTYSRAVAFSPDSTLLASADFNHLRLWDMTHNRLLKTMPHNTWVWRLTFSPDGTRLASGTTDNVVKVWEVATGQCLKVLKGEREGCSSIAFSPDGAVLAGSYHHQVRLWETKTWQPIGTLEGHSQRVAFVAIAPVPDAQGRVMVASGSHDQTVRLWDLHTRQCLHILQDHANLVWNLAFSADGQTLATSSMDGTIGLWEVATGRLRRVLKGHTHMVSAATFIPGTDWLVSASFDQTLKYWDTRQGTCVHTTVAHRGEVWGVSSTADGRHIASVGNDKAVKLWDTQTKQCLSAVGGSSSQIYGVATAGAGLVASGGDDELAHLWDVATGTCLQTFAGHRSWVWAVAASPSRQRLVTAGGDSTIKVWDFSGQCLHTLEGHTAAIYGLALSANGLTLASAGADAGAKLWNMETGECLRSFAGHRSWVWSCVLATHQPWLVTASNDETIKIWDIHTGDCLRTLTGHGERIWAVALSADDRLIVSGSEDYTAKLWDAATGECLVTFKSHSSQVKTVAFDPSGQWVATGSQDCTLKLWNLRGDCLQTFTGHESAVSCLTFLPETDQPPRPVLASGSHDETLRLWDIATGACLRVLRHPRLYEGMVLTQTQGLDEWAIAALQELGAKP